MRTAGLTLRQGGWLGDFSSVSYGYSIKMNCLDCGEPITRQALRCKPCGYKYRTRPIGLKYKTTDNPAWFSKGNRPWNFGIKKRPRRIESRIKVSMPENPREVPVDLRKRFKGTLWERMITEYENRN